LPVADFASFASLKGEFEAEGLTREELAVEVIFARARGIDYLVKIGGCEAKSDLDYLGRLGVTSVVAPMIESGFAMRKYMEMLPPRGFHHVGVTIETVHAVERIEELLDAGTRLNNVTIGRSDLTASFGGAGVDSDATMAMVRAVAQAGRRRGLEVTMGGGINLQTRALLREDAALRGLLHCVETRKVVMPVDRFAEDGVLEDAIAVELELLELRTGPAAEAVARSTKRIAQLRERV
jgi:hypothetical protein